MNPTPFPATPEAVAVLSVQEFTFDIDADQLAQTPSLERVCLAFLEDTNRALVWWIRFGAFRHWCAGTDITARARSDARIVQDACELAASFPLNHVWEFDSTDFGRAVDEIALKRARAAVGAIRAL